MTFCFGFGWVNSKMRLRIKVIVQPARVRLVWADPLSSLGRGFVAAVRRFASGSRIGLLACSFRVARRLLARSFPLVGL